MICESLRVDRATDLLIQGRPQMRCWCRARRCSLGGAGAQTARGAEIGRGRGLAPPPDHQNNPGATRQQQEERGEPTPDTISLSRTLTLARPHTHNAVERCVSAHAPKQTHIHCIHTHTDTPTYKHKHAHTCAGTRELAGTYAATITGSHGEPTCRMALEVCSNQSASSGLSAKYALRMRVVDRRSAREPGTGRSSGRGSW